MIIDLCVARACALVGPGLATPLLRVICTGPCLPLVHGLASVLPVIY